MNHDARFLEDPGLRLNSPASSSSRHQRGAAEPPALWRACSATRLGALEAAGRRGRLPARCRGDRPGVPGSARRAAPCPQGQAGDLPVHERRAVAARPVRLQAAPQPDERPGPARLGPDGTAADRHVGQPGDPAAGRLALQVRPARPLGRLGQRAPAPHGQGGRRSLLHPLASTPRRSTTTRRSPSSRPARRSRGGRRWGPG